MSCISQKIGALVIGGDYQGLGIVRSLGRRGVPVMVLDDELSIARFSRHTGRFLRVADLRDEQKTIETLLDLGRRYSLRDWVLYPTRDELVAALSRHRDRLLNWYRVPTPEWDSIKWIWDKRNTYQRAEQIGIPVPRTRYLKSSAQLSKEEWRFPLVLKPAIKEHFFYATKAKAWRVNNYRELVELFERAISLADVDEIMLQDLIPGGGENQFAYCALFKNGHPLASMVVCRKRQHPLDFGRASTYVLTIEMPLLETMSIQFLRAIDYYGLVELEYKFDPRDGQYKLLDVNGRTWGYHTVGQRAGVDFPHLLFADQSGESIQQIRSQPGICWVRLLTDIPTGVVGVWNGVFGFRDYLRSLRNVDVEAVLSLEDPLPGVAELALLPYLALKRGF